MTRLHTPVLLEEVLKWLDPRPGQRFIDGTVGHGGHAEAILKRILPTGRLLAIDRDAENLATARERLAPFGNIATFVHDSYVSLEQQAYAFDPALVDGILLDLGFSSAHVEDPARGFAFSASGPLDMRYDQSQGMTAADLVNTYDKAELTKIFRLYGEEPRAQQIAQALVNIRRQHPIQTTAELVDIILSVSPRRGKVHPATRVFQALRIAVNDELGAVVRVLPQTMERLKIGGRLAVISFHSGEDRLVKRWMKAGEGKWLRILTKKAVVPSQEEMSQNPRSRSAKLRVAERIS
ncbi:MAG TPA: 16S rRNA (cytosine(1402)-N(4))-methyltransferase RsmH [Patescibacteria group bacterium]|nr:16S rRNA (cytosine(1402)-N(4))-methyltransferase RsmH [Patescibacteria group bacterium]